MNAARLGLCLALALTGVTACDSAAAAAPQGPDHAPATRRVDADALPTFNTTPPIAEVS